MAKILFVNAFETSYLGTRALASYIQTKGYETHNVLLGSGEYIAIEQPLDRHEGYQAYSEGCLHVNEATKFGLTKADLKFLGGIIESEAPDIIGFSARSTNNWLIPELIPVFRDKAPQALLIAGGFGPTLEPELYLDGGFDCVVRCDGEEALAELMECVENEKAGKDCAQKYKILNTVWKKDDKIIINPLRSQEKNLSKYSEPLHGHSHFSFINNGVMRRHYDPEIDKNAYITYFGRGCIGHCTYCSGGQWSILYKEAGAKYYKRRNREIPEVIAELRKLPPNVKHIWFVDEYFALPSKDTLEFCSLYKEHIKKTFFTYLSYDYMLEHKDIFFTLIDAGLIGTGVGFQTGSEQFARQCYHRNLSNDHLLSFAQLCFDTNLFTGIHLIGGNCYETDEIFEQTLDLVRRLPYSIEDPWRMPLDNIRLRPHPRSPITFLSPKVVSDPMPAREWYYRAILLELARLVPIDEFNEIRGTSQYRQEPENMNKLFLKILKERQRDHFNNLVQALEGKRVVFYGAGSLYEENKKYFSALSPEAILIDNRYPTPNSLDGINVYNTDDFLTANKDSDITYLTFIRESYLPRIRLNFFNGISNEAIHSVTSILTQ